MKAGNNGEEEIGMEKSKSMIEGRNEVSRQGELASSCTRVESEREGAMKSNLVRLLSVRVNDRERERRGPREHSGLVKLQASKIL